MNESRRSIPMKQVQGGAVTETSHEPGSNKSIEVETSKIMPPLNDHPSLILSRNGDEYKQNHAFVSPRVYLKIKPASQQQEDNDESTKKPLFMILETMQTTRRVFENKEQSLDSQKSDQSGSPTVKKTISPKRSEPMNQATRPTKMATETMMMAGIHNANHMAKKAVSKDYEEYYVSLSNSPAYLTREKPVSIPRLQRSKNGINKPCFQPK
nr:hypothetical protein [Tanacetum cinerariifolium]